MIKYAFIANIPGVDPETYSAVFETKGSYNLVAGVAGMDMARTFIKKLADEGYELINLCGDFSDEMTEELRTVAGDGVRVLNVKYMIDDRIKLEFLRSSRNYGIIIQDDDVVKAHEIVLRSKACDARIIFVNNMRQARNAARRMIEKRINLIDLCSWFDILRLNSIIEATEHRVPVGTCGELSVYNIK